MVRRSDGLIWACPPSARPKTPYLDSARIRFDDGLSAAFDTGKAMIVCMSRRICVALYDEIVKLRPDWHMRTFP